MGFVFLFFLLLQSLTINETKGQTSWQYAKLLSTLKDQGGSSCIQAQTAHTNQPDPQPQLPGLTPTKQSLNPTDPPML